MKLPGLRRQCELRCWTVADLARATGLSWSTAATAAEGADVSPSTARKILLALEATPVTETALAMFDVPVGGSPVPG